MQVSAITRRTASVLAAIVTFVTLTTTAPAFADSIVHPGDKLDVVVYYHPELSSTVLVAADGTIQLPVAGSVPSEGLGTDRVAAAIQRRLTPYVPGVAVRVALEAQSEAIFIAGGPSGTLKYLPGETLVSVMDQLQYNPTQRPERFTPNPYDAPVQTEQISAAPLDLYNGPIDFKRVSVLRDGRSLGPYDLIALRDRGQTGPTLHPDDTVQLANKPVEVRVQGDVPQPGPVYVYPTDPLIRAVDQVGGTTGTSSQASITLVRGGISQVVSLGSPVFSEPAMNGDTLIVPRAPRVDVLGTVVHPGETYLRGNQTLVSAIYYAGGPDRYANLKSVQVLHHGVKTEYNLQRLQKGHDGENPPLVDGDVVFVPQGSTIDASLIFQAIASLGFLVYR